MRIANNITALSTYNSYTKNNKNISGSVKKLSTGYQINSAADNAAGLAISEKMRAQIRGLEQASKNSQDAISMVQTAEGALQSIHDILQRMRELSVQSASDTNEQTIDRAAIQAEFEQLAAEINDTASKTRFNDQNLIDGTFQKYTQYINNVQIDGDDSTAFLGSIKSMSVDRASSGDYDLTITTTSAAAAQTITPGQVCAATVGTSKLQGAFYKATIDFSGVKTGEHNGNEYTLKVTGSGDSATFQILDSNKNIVATANNVDCTTFGTAGTSVSFSGLGSITIKLDATSLASAGGKITTETDINTLNSVTLSMDETGVTEVTKDEVRGSINISLNGETVTLYKGDTSANFIDQGISFSFKALSDLAVKNGAQTFGATGTTATVTVQVSRNVGKSMVIQSGANEGDNIKINIDAMNTAMLGIKYSSVDTQAAASKSITEVNNAINIVSTQRSALGALQNRLDYKINNLDTSAENLTSAESLIRDVDMAKEMTAFTNANILQQAATAMLAQANALPQNVLSLLG